jgi:16S rRNA pseudouridine516 synthase
VKETRLRLDRLLANLGYGSRSSVQGLIRSGRITLDGAPTLDPAMAIPVSHGLPDRLRVEGEPLDPLPGLTLLLHKPAGVTCSHKAGPGEALVYDLLPPRWRLRNPALSTVGRLDKETTGLLLLTDDGALLHRISAPKAKTRKRYRAELTRPLRGDEAEVFASGTLLLEGETKPLLPASLEIESPTAVSLWLEEGRYHQVRRMFAAMGNHVLALHRDRIGGLSLPDDLEPGRWRILQDPGIIFLSGETHAHD